MSTHARTCCVVRLRFVSSHLGPQQLSYAGQPDGQRCREHLVSADMEVEHKLSHIEDNTLLPGYMHGRNLWRIVPATQSSKSGGRDANHAGDM